MTNEPKSKKAQKKKQYGCCERMRRWWRERKLRKMMTEIDEVEQLRILYSQFFRYNAAIQAELGMHRNFNQREIKRLLKKRIISEAEDFNVKEQKLMEQLVQSKIAMMHQEEFTDNLQGQNFVGDFLDIWANLEDIGDMSLGGDFFPMRQQPMGLIQIPKIFDNLLVQECIENEDKLELVKQRFANEKDKAEKEIQFQAQQSTVGRANSAAINDDN